MKLYRICHANYKDDISGNGAKLYGSRWNSQGTAMLYTSENASLGALEMLVHLNFTEVPIAFYLLTLWLPDTTSVTSLQVNKLKTNWRSDDQYTAFMGDEFIRLKENLCLKVPSAVVQEESNFLINPLHADFKKVRIESAKPFVFDNRLFHI